MKTIVILVLLVFAVGLAVVAGSRLPVDAVTVIIGVGCGVLASIPTSALMVAVTTHRANRYDQPRTSHGYPPVVVVNSPAGNAHAGQRWPVSGGAWDTLPPPAPRQFHVIGQEHERAEGNHYTEF
jgi:hypothetical protein